MHGRVHAGTPVIVPFNSKSMSYPAMPGRTRKQGQRPMRSKKTSSNSRGLHPELLTGPAAESTLLCLKCRETGHLVKNCPEEWLNDELGWFNSPFRNQYHANDKFDNGPQSICKRCHDLDLVGFLTQKMSWEDRNWQDRTDLLQQNSRMRRYVRRLGRVDTVVFTTECHVCRCLFALCPNASNLDQEIVLLPSSVIHRLEGLVKIDIKEKKQAANALSVALIPYETSINSVPDYTSRGDALCLLEEDVAKYGYHFGGRRIDPDHIDFDMIQSWLSNCSKLHPFTCAPERSPLLERISLIDVDSREVVPYPGLPCDYLALSYVWGDCKQEGVSQGCKLTELPQTIEDAITMVKKLGKRYLWVDSLCINQDDEKAKAGQIEIMSNIYRGAWATIVALSGTSANDGLPRIGSQKEMCPQMSCTINGKRLVGTMMNLSQSIWDETWGTRAWTLQEALLSRRCLYMSKQQIFFECNSMGCCESLDDSGSWVHSKLRDDEFFKHEYSGESVGAGVLRSPLLGKDRILQYGVLTTLYSYRYMSHETDGLNAFSGIVQYFSEKGYVEGFFWGLPLEDLNLALCWNPQSRRRVRRREKFPSWAWVGWEGSLWPGLPVDPENPHQCPVPVKIWKFENGKLVKLFEQSTLDGPKRKGDLRSIKFSDDPVATRAYDAVTEDHSLSLQTLASTDIASNQLLIIEAITLDLTQNRGQWEGPFELSDGRVAFSFTVQDAVCQLQVYPKYAHVIDKLFIGSEKPLMPRCMLLARDSIGDEVWHQLLLPRFEAASQVGEREAIMTLMIPANRLDVLEEWSLRKDRIALV